MDAFKKFKLSDICQQKNYDIIKMLIRITNAKGFTYLFIIILKKKHLFGSFSY